MKRILSSPIFFFSLTCINFSDAIPRTFLQEIEPSIGERLCRLWADVSEDDSGAPREKRKTLISHQRKDTSLPSYHHHITPMIPAHYPPIPIFHDGRHPHQIHLNPALYPPPPRLGSYNPYFWGRPPRPPYSPQGPSKRYSAQHRARSRTTPTAKDS